MGTCATCGSKLSGRGVLWVDQDTGNKVVICSKCAKKVRQKVHQGKGKPEWYISIKKTEDK